MIHKVVNVLGRNRVVRLKRVGVDRRSCRDVLLNDRHKRTLAGVGDNLRLDLAGSLLATAFNQAMHDCLAHSAGAVDLFTAAGKVHVLSFATDVGFVAFDGSGELGERSATHRMADPMKHEPRRLLRDAQRPRHFATADTILGVGDAPDRDEPLIQSERAFLEDRSDLGAKLLLRMFRPALPPT